MELNANKTKMSYKNKFLLVTRRNMLVDQRVDIEILGNERRNILSMTFIDNVI